MATIQTPIPQNKIEESFVWRDWFQKLSNRVYGSMTSQDAGAVLITGGAIDNTPIGANTPNTGAFSSLVVGLTGYLKGNGTSAVTALTTIPNTDITGLGTMSTQNVGISTTVTLAKLTSTGSNGSLTISNGIITAYTAPT